MNPVARPKKRVLTEEQRQKRAAYERAYRAMPEQQQKRADAAKVYYAKNKEKRAEAARQYVALNRDKVNAYKRGWSSANQDKIQGYTSKHREKHSEVIKKRSVLYIMSRRKTDPIFNLSFGIRSLIAKAITKKGYSKRSRTHEILGCSFEFFKNYIEQRFMDGMSWENRSEWHLDHIIPVSSAKTEKQLLKLNHYTNFRPLWAIDNLRKHNKTNEQLNLLAA
jgi:hypothetical protein